MSEADMKTGIAFGDAIIIVNVTIGRQMSGNVIDRMLNDQVKINVRHVGIRDCEGISQDFGIDNLATLNSLPLNTLATAYGWAEDLRELMDDLVRIDLALSQKVQPDHQAMTIGNQLSRRIVEGGALPVVIDRPI